MIQFHSLEIPQLERFLERQKSGLSLQRVIDLDLILRQILQKANEFVPSESGSILLDDPFRKVASRRENELVFIATFGDSSRDLIGQRELDVEGRRPDNQGRVADLHQLHLEGPDRGRVHELPSGVGNAAAEEGRSDA